MEKKLFRNEHDKMIAGVASGLADYMQVEITIVRLLFVLSAVFLAGVGLVAYLVMWVILPVNNDPAAKFSQFSEYFKNNPGAGNFTNQNPFENPSQPNWTQPSQPFQEKKPFETQTEFTGIKKSPNTGRTVAGLLLVVIGCIFMLKEFDLIPDFLRLRNLWPVILIAFGISIIAKSRKKNEWQEWQEKENAAMNAKVSEDIPVQSTEDIVINTENKSENPLDEKL